MDEEGTQCPCCKVVNGHQSNCRVKMLHDKIDELAKEDDPEEIRLVYPWYNKVNPTVF